MRTWTPAQDDMMREFYVNHDMKDLMRMIGKSECAIYNRSHTLSVKKSKEYLDSPKACRLRRGGDVGKEFRFSHGHESFNKGRKQTNYMAQDAIERTKATRFKKGTRPPNHKPVGTKRVTRDGYLEIKTAEGMRKWRLFHRVFWERLNGKIPKGMNLIFLDGDKQNVRVTNLSLVTRKQNMQRNSLHRFPKEIAHLIQLQGAINRQINKRTNNHEQH